MIRILIADDHAVVRAGLRRILEDEDDIQVTGEAETGAEALSLALRQTYQVLVLDISMPGLSGVEVLKDLKRARPDLPVLVLSIHPEEQYAVRVIRAGAMGYLSKESAADDLVRAVRTVARGEKFLTAKVADLLAEAISQKHSSMPHEVLSDREFEVFRSLAQGKTVTDIAENLSLSVKTVSTYRTRLLEKLNVRTNAEVARYAVEKGLI